MIPSEPEDLSDHIKYAAGRNHLQMRGHRITDPACTQYRDPTNWLERWWWNRGRGRACDYCMRQRARWQTP